MQFLRRYWYNIGLFVALVAGVYLAFVWHDMAILQRLLMLNFIAFLIHQFEEYGYPGGEPAIINRVMRSDSPAPDRYPLNQNSAFVTNAIIGWPMYLIPVFFPNILWLGMAPMFIGLVQFFVHAVITNVKLKAFYNPGMGAVVLLHVPIGIYYIYYIKSMSIAGVWDWVFGVVFTILSVIIIFQVITYRLLADKNSPYTFASEEMKRFNVEEKLNAKGISAKK